MEISTNKEHLFLEAANNYVNENYRHAITKFSELIKLDEKNHLGYLYRASSNIKLGKYEEALNDLEKAEKLTSDLFEIYYKKGIAAFMLENFLDSNDYFKAALKVANNPEQRQKLVIWSNKLEIELDEIDQLKKSNTEVHSYRTEISNIKFIENWYQNMTHIILTLTSNVPLSSDQLEIILQKKSILIKNKHNGFTLFEMNLSNSIIPDSSTFDVNNRKLELKLKKEVDNFNWVSIDRAKVKEVASNVVPSYPTSAKVKKDWNNVEKEINQELANDAKNDPNEGMMRLFREIYGNANEETRRAMIKSFQTSGGTVLSTDWNEVKEKDYEGRDRPDAPKGQEWRKNEV